MKKILHILAIKPRGGVGTFLKNTYTKDFPYKFDIVESGDSIEGDFDDYFINLGSTIYLFPSIKYKNIVNYYLKCRDFYKKNSYKYDAVHIHSTAVAYFHLYFAKKYNIKVRIFHAHASFSNNNKIKNIIDNFLLTRIYKYSTHFFSCGKELGDAMLKDSTFQIIPNGIHTNTFKFNLEKRLLIRKNLNIGSCDKLVGIIGRFSPEKNQDFVIELAIYMKDNKNTRFIFFGDGELLNECKENVIKNNLSNVTFLGKINNISDYYSALDIVLMPSVREGFSLVTVEAQCNGLPLIFSSTLAKSMKLLEEGTFLNTDVKELERWRSFIEKYETNIEKRKISCNVVAENYSVENTRKILASNYKKILGE